MANLINSQQDKQLSIKSEMANFPSKILKMIVHAMPSVGLL